MQKLLTFIFIFSSYTSLAQPTSLSGTVKNEQNEPVPHSLVLLEHTPFGTLTDSLGQYQLSGFQAGTFTLQVSALGYQLLREKINLQEAAHSRRDWVLASGERQMNEIVVTGLSHATLARENPLATISISSRQLARSSENNVIDALVKYTPGLSAVKTGPNISKPFIRGLGYNRVLTLYDGIRQEGQQWGDEHGLELDPYHLEKVEVIKGPASLMFGSDALAGVISFFPQSPKKRDGKLHGQWTGEYQSNNNLIGSGLGLSWGNNHWEFAANTSWRIAGNYRNAVDGRVYATAFSEKNIAALLGYRTENRNTRLKFTYYNNHQGIPDGSRDSLSRKFTYQTAEGANDDPTARPLVPEKDLLSYRVPDLSQRIEHYRLYLQNQFETSAGDLSLCIGGQQNKRTEFTHPTRPAQPGMQVLLRTLNYDLRFQFQEVYNMALSIGVNGMLQSNKSLDATDFPIPDYRLAEGGVYGHAKWKKKDWTLSGGLRYDIRQVRWDALYLVQDPETGFDRRASNADLPYATKQFEAQQKNFTGTSASFGITYQVSSHLGLKTNIGSAYRAPNIPELASNGLDPGAHIIYLGNAAFKPEVSLQEDLGITLHYPGFSAMASFFHNQIDHYIYQALVVDANGTPLTDAQGNRTYQYQQTKSVLYGAECWLALHPQNWKGFRMDNNLSVVYGSNKAAAYKGAGVQGAYLPLLPPLQLNSSISQAFYPAGSFFRSLSPKAEVEFAGAQNRYLGIHDSETPTPSYTLVHAGIAAEIKPGNLPAWQLLVQVNNLLDKVYQSHLSRLKYFEYYAQSPGGRLGIYNMGRNVCMKLTVSF